MKGRRRRKGELFTINYKHSVLRPDENYKAVKESKLKTYWIHKEPKRKLYVISELDRKNKPKTIKTISFTQAGKRTQTDLIRQLRNRKIPLHNKNIITIRTEQGQLNIIQTNYLVKRKTFCQLVGNVRVYDVERNIKGFYIGYSKKIPSALATSEEISDAREQVEDMAVWRFIQMHGSPPSMNFQGGFDDSGDASDLSKFHAFDVDIIDLRYQYYVGKMRK